MVTSHTPKNIATIIAANHFINLNQHNLTNSTATDGPPIAGLNLLFVGVLIGCVMIMLACICYLWQWNFNKSDEPSSARYNTRVDSWLHLSQMDTPVHIFTLDNQEVSGDMEDFEIPPPSYDEVVKSADADLPSYETAINLSARGYV